MIGVVKSISIVYVSSMRNRQADYLSAVSMDHGFLAFATDGSAGILSPFTKVSAGNSGQPLTPDTWHISAMNKSFGLKIQVLNH